MRVWAACPRLLPGSGPRFESATFRIARNALPLSHTGQCAKIIIFCFTIFSAAMKRAVQRVRERGRHGWWSLTNRLTSSADSAMKNPWTWGSNFSSGPGLIARQLSFVSGLRASTAIKSSLRRAKHNLQKHADTRSTSQLSQATFTIQGMAHTLSCSCASYMCSYPGSALANWAQYAATSAVSINSLRRCCYYAYRPLQRIMWPCRPSGKTPLLSSAPSSVTTSGKLIV